MHGKAAASAALPASRAGAHDNRQHLQIGHRWRWRGVSGVLIHLDAPVICITAHGEPAIREQSLAAGCAAHFRKTDSGEAVLQVVRRVAKAPGDQT